MQNNTADATCQICLNGLDIRLSSLNDFLQWTESSIHGLQLSLFCVSKKLSVNALRACLHVIVSACGMPLELQGSAEF